MIDMYMRSRAEGFGDEVKRRIMLGTYALSAGYYDAYYKRALRVRRLIRRDFDEAFKVCDCLMGPTSPTPAFRIGERAADPLAMYLSDVYTVSSNLAGIASISLPCGLTAAGLPVGLQILSDVFTEERLLGWPACTSASATGPRACRRRQGVPHERRRPYAHRSAWRCTCTWRPARNSSAGARWSTMPGPTRASARCAWGCRGRCR